MTRTLKIFGILLATLGLIAFMGSNSVLMASHATHFVSDKGPHLPQNESGCTTCHAAGNLQCDPSGPLFADSTPEEPRDLNATTVCDPCHSKGGAYNGVQMAKDNWDAGVYNEPGDSLLVEDWCAGCHDDGTSVVESISAPNVMGDNATYGFKASGHGRPGIDKKCEACHDLALSHIDGLQRTYSASSSPNNYKSGYRLIKGMIVPRPGHEIEDGTFELCTDSCHDYTALTNDNTHFTNFHGEAMDHQYPCMIPRHNWHSWHLSEGTTYNSNDSDFDGVIDSYTTCIICHNVHGSPMEFDTGTTDIVIDDFNGYTDRPDLYATWTRGWDASWAYLASNYGPDGSDCMAVKMTWNLSPEGAGFEWRDLAPIDLTHMEYISFYVNVYYVPAFYGFKIGLRRSQDDIWAVAELTTSELGLQNRVWKLVSVPKDRFDSDFGEVNGVVLIAYENNPSHPSFATWILFDDIRCAVTTTEYHPNPVMIRHGELISTPGTTDKVPAFDFKWYDDDGDCIPGQPALSVGDSRWGRMVVGGSLELSVNHVCTGCHNVERPGLEYGEVQYYRVPLE